MRSLSDIKRGYALLARFYREFIKPRKAGYFAICILHILFAGALIAPPYLLKDIIDKGIAEKDAPLITLLSIILFLVFAAVAIVDKVRSYWGHIVAQRITYTLRNRLYSHLQKLSFSFYDNIKIGELLSRIIDDLNITQEILYHGPQNIITNGFVLFFTAGMMLVLNFKLALICLVVMVLIGICNFFIARRMFMGARQERTRKASLASRTEDNLSGIRIIQSFVREHHEMDRFDQENKAHYGSRLQVITPMSWLFPVSMLILGLSLALAAGLGGHAVLSGTMTVGVLTAFVMYLQRFMWPMLALAMISEQITRFFAGIERYFNYMDIEPDVKDRPDAIQLGRVEGEIRFENVWFRYENEDILKGIDLTINPGETVALVGPSGAGKTTITSLIPRFYDPYHGSLFVDGHDIRDVKLQSLRDNIGLVMQNDYLFSDTLINNIAYGRLDATREEIFEAARQANVD
ncbi:MAG: ABC transporter ATP-binding protein, partial [Verrucomicrobiota bacterium]